MANDSVQHSHRPGVNTRRVHSTKLQHRDCARQLSIVTNSSNTNVSDVWQVTTGILFESLLSARVRGTGKLARNVPDHMRVFVYSSNKNEAICRGILHETFLREMWVLVFSLDALGSCFVALEYRRPLIAYYR